LVIGILDIRTGMIDYVNAGQNPPLLISASTGTAEFKREISGPPAGAMENVPYRLLSLQLHPGDMLVVYTDGITEAMSPAKAEYGNDRLQDKVCALADATAEVIVAAVIDDVNLHSAEEEQSDDITILCLSWRGDPSQTMISTS
jgi:phosphoserine phosphatase RsbU/P